MREPEPTREQRVYGNAIGCTCSLSHGAAVLVLSYSTSAVPRHRLIGTSEVGLLGHWALPPAQLIMQTMGGVDSAVGGAAAGRRG